MYNISYLSATDQILCSVDLVVLDGNSYRANEQTYINTLKFSLQEAQRRVELSHWLQKRVWLKDAETALAFLDYELRLQDEITRCSTVGAWVLYRQHKKKLQQTYLRDEVSFTAAAMVREGWTVVELPGEGWLVEAPINGEKWHTDLHRCECQASSCIHRMLATSVYQACR